VRYVKLSIIGCGRNYNYSNYAASQYYVRRCGLLLQTEQRALSVGLSVSLFVTVVKPAKTA